ncbi:MAG: RNA 2',3'-cyclic phosphodiesterase [Methanocorpusculum sp.]|nr:RNA 2',3'-cyclic phosphodiesterase [Methanocorpusculum sp.]
MVRTFIAIEPAPEIRKKIADAGIPLRENARITPVSPDLMHITLKFLGEIPDTLIPEIKTALDKISAAPYPLPTENISTFGRPPRVIKAEIHDSGKTAALAGQIDKLLAPLGIPKDDKPFSPHITIARIKDAAPGLTPQLRELQNTRFGTCIISELLLKKSVLTTAGPIYTTLYRVKL